LPSTASSSTPVIVTVFAIFQLAGVKTRLVVEVIPSLAFVEVTGMVTFAAGGVFNPTLNVAKAPLSLVTSPLFGVTDIPGCTSDMPWPNEIPSDAIATTSEPSRLAR